MLIQQNFGSLFRTTIWHTHPRILRSLEHRVLYMCAIDDALTTSSLANVDIIQVEKHTLVATVDVEKAMISRRRFTSGDSFFDGFLRSMVDNNVDITSLINSATGGWFNCVRNAVSTARDLYSFFVSGTGRLLDIFHQLARALVDCISAATNSSPVGWLRRIYQGARLILRASSIARNCGGLWSTHQRHGFNSFEMGQGVGNCINALTRRRRSAIDVPKEWKCDPEIYDAFDACDVGCGAYDPDCSDPTLPVLYNIDKHVGSKPSEVTWSCPDSFYNSTDGCDTGCGSTDPDCSNPSNLETFSWEPRFALAVAAEKSYASSLEKVSEDDETKSSHTLTTFQIVLVITGTAFASVMICGTIFYIATNKRHRRSRDNYLGASLVQHGEQAQEAYGLQ